MRCVFSHKERNFSMREPRQRAVFRMRSIDFDGERRRDASAGRRMRTQSIVNAGAEQRAVWCDVWSLLTSKKSFLTSKKLFSY